MALSSLLILPLVTGALSDGKSETPSLFAEPVMLTAGSKPMGRGILYPSPHLYDVDGDGQKEMLIGDLVGVLHVAEKLSGDDPLAWSELEPLKGADGEKLKFSNW